MHEKKLSRRDAIKLLGAAVGATALANLPSKWNKPELTSGVLPAHAQTSVAVSCVGYAPGAQIFSSPGILDFVVPACVTSLLVDAYGAQGGAAEQALSGGLGGRITLVISVTPGELLTILVGGVGGNGNPAGGAAGAAGTNGGGAGAFGGIGGSGGGGWSGVERSGTILVAAGGGGGAGGFTNGGSGGGTTGGNGVSGGLGGDQVQGGAGAGGGGNGSAELGGNAGSPGGGGGGGGYFGGGGGGNSHTGGGGGSSFPPAATHQQGVRSGNGQVILTW